MAEQDHRYATPAEDLAGYLTRYPHQLAFGDDEPTEVMDCYHTPAFEMINDGIRLDRQRLLDHVASARKNATAVRVDVHECITEQTRVAARYTLTATMRKGAVIATEIYMFGDLAADGRLRRVCQATRTVPVS